jgi:hypothetical protein
MHIVYKVIGFAVRTVGNIIFVCQATKAGLANKKLFEFIWNEVNVFLL